jgi:hypothetical protein
MDLIFAKADTTYAVCIGPHAGTPAMPFGVENVGSQFLSLRHELNI